MKKFIVETYYTCTFKTVHTLDSLNDHELSQIDKRNDGEVKVIDVKLNNRKTKKIGDKKQESKNTRENNDPINPVITEKIISKKAEINMNEPVIKVKNNAGSAINCSFVIFGERKDVDKIVVEYEGKIEDYPGKDQRSIVGYHYDYREGINS